LSSMIAFTDEFMDLGFFLFAALIINIFENRWESRRTEQFGGRGAIEKKKRTFFFKLFLMMFGAHKCCVSFECLCLPLSFLLSRICSLHPSPFLHIYK
jgi:hypothetical protein